MKTCLLTPCFLDGNDPAGYGYLERNLRYIRYYLPLKAKLGFDKIVFMDNASTKCNVDALKLNGGDDIIIHRFDERLTGGKFKHDYPYCWRAVYGMLIAIEQYGFDKIVMVDSDGFILSERLAAHVRNTNTGWSSIWCPLHQFADSSFQILCPDSHIIFRNYITTPWIDRNGEMMEASLPFTSITHDFVADRFGEMKMEQSPNMDYFGQANLNTTFSFKTTVA